MPLLFSYGSLRDEGVQLSAFGRRLYGSSDSIVGCEPSLVLIEDADLAAELGKTHHNNLRFNGSAASRVEGMVFDVTDAELEDVDRYEATFAYARVLAPLASGRDAWVYLHMDELRPTDSRVS